MSKNNRSLSLRRKEEELADMESKTQQIKDWIEGLLKEKLPKASFREILLDGVVLCKLANAIKKDCIKRFHKKPRMLMMKMENIAFFLTACKTRFNIPQAVIFAPTDIHDDSDPTSMRKVINVLLLMKQEMGGGPSAAEAAKELEEQEAKRQQELEELEAQDIAAGVLDAPTPKPKPAPVFEIPATTDGAEEPTLEDEEEPAPHAGEPEPEPEEAKKEPEAEPEPEPEPKPAPKAEPPKKVEPPKAAEPAKHVEPPKHAEPAKTAEPAKNAAHSTNGGATSHTLDFDYYLKGKASPDHAQVQTKILGQLVEVINTELSLEAKMKLVHQLQGHVNAVHHKVMSSSTEELKTLAFEMGLGHAASDVPANKDRQWYIDFILKHGRAQ